ncbi:transcription factor bHLH96-like [Musa acuminata AAA Group]|uniref:transcription factor bHLH96-like n=1 Tax=Musa acuminata AAA Group TaxID=214697 RepID=UPI0031D0CC63
MTLEALASAGLPPFFFYDTITATTSHRSGRASSSRFHNAGGDDVVGGYSGDTDERRQSAEVAGQGRRKRRRQRTHKNKEDAENQRMTHIAVERNRRRQMNEHLAVLRSLMPDSYIQRGDQASIVGGAIDFVKELEQLLQSLEAQKRTLQQRQAGKPESSPATADGGSRSSSSHSHGVDSPPFAQFFTFPQYGWRHPAAHDYPQPEDQLLPALADIEVTLIETHANVRILSPKRPHQLVKIVCGLQDLKLSILHLSLTTLDAMVLYSLSVKVEEGCNLATVDDIAAAIHRMLCLIQAEATAAAQ